MAKLEWSPLDDQAVKTAKALAADAVEKAGNGHPGTAISLAPVAHLLFQKVMRHDPRDPAWIGRDRFILSAGHSSLTLYNQLFLGGFGLELDDIKSLRKWGSKTPGHPEYGHTPGVEITTGPLGQGLASAVGFSYASRFERGLFDPDSAPGTSPFDHFIYCIAGDGDMQEGVTSEASSLAGHQELGNLIVIYDSNQISIEDDTNVAFTENILGRYEAYGWHVQVVDWKPNGGYKEDVHSLYDAVLEAQEVSNKPSLIILKTIIGWPSPTKQNTGKIHGSALGAEEVAGLKRELGFDPDQSFFVDEAVLGFTRNLVEKGRQLRQNWQEQFEAWAQAHPDKKTLFDRINSGKPPAELSSCLPKFNAGDKVSTRAASGKVINSIANIMPELWGGSADLAESNNTTISSSKSFIPSKHSTREWQGDVYGRVLHFGVREHAMGAILNGIVLHGKTRPFGGTFLIFSDYMRPAIRLAALMKIPSIFVWTHDSIALGEDGPTHQPVEQLASLRAIPGLDVIRPADAAEVAIAWKTILERRNGPAGLALTRQNVPVFDRETPDETGVIFASEEGVAKGAYIFAEAASGSPELVLIATGSELELAVEARLELQRSGIQTRVVSAPCLEWFEEQPKSYRDEVLPESVRNRVSVEAGLSLGWSKYLGANGKSISIETFGASADYATLFKEYGMNVDNVVETAKKMLGNS